MAWRAAQVTLPSGSGQALCSSRDGCHFPCSSGSRPHNNSFLDVPRKGDVRSFTAQLGPVAGLHLCPLLGPQPTPSGPAPALLRPQPRGWLCAHLPLPPSLSTKAPAVPIRIRVTLLHSYRGSFMPYHRVNNLTFSHTRSINHMDTPLGPEMPAATRLAVPSRSRPVHDHVLP